mgnify:CR=1 FL=1
MQESGSTLELVQKVLCKLINLVYKGGAAFSLVIEMYSVVISLCQYLI